MQGFDALRVLAEQYVLESCSAQATTNGVHVEITTACIGSKIPLDLIETPTACPVWTYRVRIENVGCVDPPVNCKIRSKSWLTPEDRKHTCNELERMTCCWGSQLPVSSSISCSRLSMTFLSEYRLCLCASIGVSAPSTEFVCLPSLGSNVSLSVSLSM